MIKLDSKVKFNSLYLECLSKKDQKIAISRSGTIVKIYGIGMDVRWENGEVMPECIINLEESE